MATVKGKLKSASRKTIKKAAKKEIRDSIKRKRKAITKGRPKLYTDAEKKYLRSLYNKRNRIKRQINKAQELSLLAEKSIGPSLKDIREYISDDTAKTLYYEGYFDEDKYDDYWKRSFREWMLSNADGDALTAVMDEYATGTGRTIEEIEAEFQDMEKNSDTYKEAMKMYDDLMKELNHTQGRIEGVRERAKLRQEEWKVKAAIERLKLKGELKEDLSLVEAIDKGVINTSKLTKPERLAFEHLKKYLVKSIVKSDAVQELDPEQKSIAKNAIAAAVMKNPVEGIRVAIKDTVVNDIVKQYGNAAGPIANSLIDLATGKGSIKSVGLGFFEGVVIKSGYDTSTMMEKAEELVSLGESSSSEENMKMFGRDILIDMAKSIIKSGGNIYAAIPMMAKSVMFDVVKAGTRQHTIDSSAAKRAKEIAKNDNSNSMSEEELKNKFFT